MILHLACITSGGVRHCLYYMFLRMSLRRDHLLEDSYRYIMSTSSKSLRTKSCHVTWKGEEGLDYGGPQREFFFKLSRLLFNPFYGLFEYTTHGAYTVQISRHSSSIDDANLWSVPPCTLYQLILCYEMHVLELLCIVSITVNLLVLCY